MKFDKQALRKAAEKATEGNYVVGHCDINKHGNLSSVYVCQEWNGEAGGVVAECHVNCLTKNSEQVYANAGFMAFASPANVLSLLEEISALEARCAALAAENAGLKAGASYFSYGSEHNFEWHKTAEEAVEAAEAAIDDYRGDACDGWSEEVDSICWGVIMQSSTKVGERPRNEDDCCDPAIDTICDYALLPSIETPATDAFLAEVRAQGVEMLREHPAIKLCSLTHVCDEFAAQLRKDGATEEKQSFLSDEDCHAFVEAFTKGATQ